MSNLKNKDIKALLVEFQATKGYFLDFTNNQFEEFFEDFDIEIYEDKYNSKGNSKANRFKEFLSLESDELISKVLEDLRKI